MGSGGRQPVAASSRSSQHFGQPLRLLLLLLARGAFAFGAEYAWAYAPLLVWAVTVALLGWVASRGTPFPAIAVQEVSDFTLQMPGAAALFVMLAAVAIHRPVQVEGPGRAEPAQG